MKSYFDHEINWHSKISLTKSLPKLEDIMYRHNDRRHNVIY